MHLSTACCKILNQLSDLVIALKNDDYTAPSKTLSNSTIGQHLRHTLEFFICLEQGYERGLVNYDQRSHDKLIETDKYLALNTIHKIAEFISAKQSDQPLQLQVGYDSYNADLVTVETNYFRELIYNIEHAVHHMAIMKIGIREVAPYITLSADFGVAVSTLRYKEKEALVNRC